MIAFQMICCKMRLRVIKSISFYIRFLIRPLKVLVTNFSEKSLWWYSAKRLKPDVFPHFFHTFIYICIHYNSSLCLSIPLFELIFKGEQGTVALWDTNPQSLNMILGWLLVGFKANCPLVRPGPIGGMPSEGSLSNGP